VHAVTWGARVIARPAQSGRKRIQRARDWWFVWTGVHMSLAFKLAVPVVITTAVLAAVMGSVITNQVSTQIQGAYDREADSVAAGVEAIFLEHPNDIAQVDVYLARLIKSRPDLVSVRIVSLDADTTVIASGNRGEVGVGGLVDDVEKQAVWSGRGLQAHDHGDALVTVAPLKNGDLLFGAVVITSSRGPEFDAIRSITIGIGVAAFLSIGLEWVLVLSALYFFILRRTRRVQRVVEAVARGDASKRLPEGEEARGRDEIFNLAQTVDHMIVSLDERQRGEELIRSLGQKALQGVPAADLITEGLNATRVSLGLEACIFAHVDEDGTLINWLDGSSKEQSGRELPVWVFALTRVAIDARRAVLTDRLGRQSRFAESPGVSAPAQAAIVPLPRSSKAGQAIVAIAPRGETIPHGGLAVLDAIAATIADSLHMQAAENARAESAVKSKVMSAVSHEMRNPLNSILGFTALVLGAPGSTLNEKQRRQLGHVQTSANNMLGLVNNYLDLARVRSGAIAFQYETVKVGPLLADLLTSLQPMATEKKIVIRSSINSDAEARVDPTRVRQIAGNLLSNAVKFTPAGGCVTLRARSDKDWLRITVSDNGVGIQKGQQKLLFTEFSKIEAGAMSGSKGTGLGLTVTMAYLSAMGGQMRVYSRPGRGSTFAILLPCDGGSTKRGGLG
jgi:signal transduction histidine kinase/HAMP domain-containing protein